MLKSFKLFADKQVRAFSVMEAMVSMAIMSVTFLVFFGIFHQIQNSFHQSTDTFSELDFSEVVMHLKRKGVLRDTVMSGFHQKVWVGGETLDSSGLNLIQMHVVDSAGGQIMKSSAYIRFKP
jgi:hypothetical protein